MRGRWILALVATSVLLVPTGCEMLHDAGLLDEDSKLGSVDGDSKKKTEPAEEEVYGVKAPFPQGSQIGPYPVERDYRGYLSGDGNFASYSFSAISASEFRVHLEGPSTADYDLYLSVGDVPTTHSYDARGFSLGSVEDCRVVLDGPCTVYILVRSYNGKGPFSLSLGFGDPPELERVLAQSHHPYTNDYDNSWTITSSGARRMRIHFLRLETESGYDFVILHDASGVEVAVYDGNYNDIWSPWVTGDTIRVRLVTDSSITNYGFLVDDQELAYTDVEANATVVAESEHPYRNNTDQTWEVTSLGATRVRVHFLRLETESGFDYVSVYSEKGVLVAEYDGSHYAVWTPWVDGESLTIGLLTDGSIVGYGFVVDDLEAMD